MYSDYFWRNTIKNLIEIYAQSGGHPRRIVLNNFTYKLIMNEFSRNDPWVTNHKSIYNLDVLIDNSYRNLKKIVIEIDDGF